jgi:hypothetical protein
MLNDPTPHRVSSCPVHFIWDGRGFGRVFVRAGFLMLLVGMALLTGATATGFMVLKTPAAYVLGLALVVWSSGQALSFVVARTAARAPSRS